MLHLNVNCVNCSMYHCEHSNCPNSTWLIDQSCFLSINLVVVEHIIVEVCRGSPDWKNISKVFKWIISAFRIIFWDRCEMYDTLLKMQFVTSIHSIKRVTDTPRLQFMAAPHPPHTHIWSQGNWWKNMFPLNIHLSVL